VNSVPPAATSVPEAALTRCLREIPDAVVLRNEEDLVGNLRRGGDVDLLAADAQLAEQLLVRHLGAPVQIARRSYSVGYSYDWGHVDVQSTFEWRGAAYLDAHEVLAARRVSARGIPVPSLAHEATISWMANLLFGGFFKERYADGVREAVAADGPALRETLIQIAGRRWGARLWQSAVEGHPERSTGWSGTLRRLVWRRAFVKAPFATLRRGLAYVRTELALRLAPPVPWLAILGSDGSGKSTVVDALVRRFSACPYAKARPFHWRPRLVARSHGAEPVSDPHGQPSRGFAGSVLRLAVLGTDWVLGYWGRLVHLRAKEVILVFDRIYFDLVVDPKRYRYGAGRRLARALWWWLPKPDLVFFLDVPPAVLLQRKQEVTRAELERQQHDYTSLTQERPGGHVLDGSQPVEAVVDEIQDTVRAWMLERSITSLRKLHGPSIASETTVHAPAAPALPGRADPRIVSSSP
jgi:hypothetical protein